MEASYFFVGLAVLVGASLVLAVLDVIDSFFDYYGGFLGTAIAIVINTVQWCFYAWLLTIAIKLLAGLIPIPSLAGLISGLLDPGLGFVLGPLYTLYCWKYFKPNRLVWILSGIKLGK